MRHIGIMTNNFSKVRVWKCKAWVGEVNWRWYQLLICHIVREQYVAGIVLGCFAEPVQSEAIHEYVRRYGGYLQLVCVGHLSSY